VPHETAPRRRGTLLPIDLEVVTVTDSSVVITWFTGSATETDAYGRPAPVPADTEVLLGEPGRRVLRTVLQDPTPTPYHYAEITGLDPDRTYTFEARSAGEPAVQTSLQFPGTRGSIDIPGTFTTLATPPGSYLFTVAVAGDTHIGENASGIIAAGWPQPFRQDPGLSPYPEVMLTAMLSELCCPARESGPRGRPPEIPRDASPERSATPSQANQGRPDPGTPREADPERRPPGIPSGASHPAALIIVGDTTAEAAPRDVARVRELLDGLGQLGTDYMVVRGNHDRPHTGTRYAAGTPVPSAPDHYDCWGDVFPHPRQQLSAYELGGLRIVGLDTTTLDAAGGTLDDAQLAELRRLLRDDPYRPTFVFGHHPVTYESDITTPASPGFILEQAKARELEALYAKAPGVFLHAAGHTHRNKWTSAPDAPGTEFLEIAAVKEYPGGYSLLRLHTGGYLVSYYKTRADLARRWSQRTRGEYFGIFPHYAFGTIADRNHTVVRDLSGLRPPPQDRCACRDPAV